MLGPPIGAAPTAPQLNLPSYNQEAVRHLLIGDYGAIADTINCLERLGYCDLIARSETLPTGRNGEYISVIIRKRTLS